MAQNVAIEAAVSENEVVNEVVNTAEENVNEVNNVSYQNIIKKLIASGSKRINSIRVKNVNYDEKENHTMVSFTLDKKVPGFVSNDEGLTYEKGMTNTIFSSTFAIAGALKEDEELAWLGNAVVENPNSLNLILNGSTIDIIQEEISAGEEYVNPFTNKDEPEPTVFDHDTIITHIIRFKLGKTGEKMCNLLATKMLGF